MDLEELRGFLAVVETGSMLGAATSLGIPRGTLRRRVDALEARAGVPLLERSAKGVTATEAGRVLAERGHRLLAEGSALLASVREIGREPGGTVRLRLPIGMPPQAVVVHTELLRAMAPRIALSVRVCEDPLAGLKKEEIDLAVHFGERELPPAWIAHELLSIPVRILASPEYLARHGRPATIAALHEHPLASWIAPGGRPDHWPRVGGGTFEVRPVLVSNDAHTLRLQVRAGLALALLPDADLDPLGLSADPLVPVLEDVVGTRISLTLAVPRALAQSPRLTHVVALMRRFTSRSEEPRGHDRPH
ncbi:MAG: LysR family transcriptional regulator [Myxococcota bacterium]